MQATKGGEEAEDNFSACDDQDSKIRIKTKNADSLSLRHQSEEWDSDAPNNDEDKTDDVEYKPKAKSSTIKPVRTPNYSMLSDN